MSLLYSLFWFLLVALCSGSVLQSPNAGGNFELLILHNNDMHARFEQTSQLSGACTTADREAGKCYGGFPRVAHVVKEARRAAAAGEGPPVLYLNAGDTYTGTAWFTIYKWKIAAEFLNALQPDAVSLGNHEFDERIEGLVPFIRNISTPVLAANLDLNNVPELLNEPNLHKSVVLLVNNVKIGVIGYLTAETKFLAPKNKVEYEDEVLAISREIEKLKSQGVKIFIALGHSGFIKDVEIAKNVKDIDLVIGGHSNTFLWNGDSNEKPESVQGSYPVIIQQPSGRSIPIVQAYAYTKYLGKLKIVFDRQGEIVSFDGNPTLLSQDIPEDKELIKIVNKYENDVDRINKEAIGTSNILLNGDQCRLRECNLGNFITDAIMTYTKTYYMDHYYDANIAIMQGGRIRTSIDHSSRPFKVTREDIITALPFSDQLSVVTMNGTVLLQALEHAVDTWRVIDSTGQFLQFTGVQVVYDFEKPPGSRVTKANAVCSSCVDGKLNDIKADVTYKLIMPSFLAEGGDGFKIFESLPTEVLPYNEVDCVIDYLKKYSPITPKVTDRITVLNEGKVKISTENFQTVQSHVMESELIQSSKQVSVNASVVNVIILISVIVSLSYYQ